MIAAPAAGNSDTADRAALAGIAAIDAADTTLDADPNATVRREIDWLTPSFAAQVRAFPPVAAPGAVWNSWAAHRAFVVVSTALVTDDRPSDIPATAYRQVAVTQRPIGRDGWRGPAVQQVLFVTLGNVDGQWRLASEQGS